MLVQRLRRWPSIKTTFNADRDWLWTLSNGLRCVADDTNRVPWRGHQQLVPPSQSACAAKSRHLHGESRHPHGPLILPIIRPFLLAAEEILSQPLSFTTCQPTHLTLYSWDKFSSMKMWIHSQLSCFFYRLDFVLLPNIIIANLLTF